MKKCLLIRYGGIGDSIQTSSVFPGLKKQGFHLTVNTTPQGYQILKSDPYVDAFWLQDTDQVPNENLTEYWNAISKEFDHTINLSESVEGTLLAIPGRRNHSMSLEARHALMDVNYQEFVHALADVSEPYEQRFYPTAAERTKVEAWRKRHLGGAPLVLWPLAGSSVHKVWPWLDKALDRLLSQSPAHIMFVGDAGCQLLELGALQTVALNQLQIPYEESDAMGSEKIIRRLQKKFWPRPRVHPKCGRLGIRETLTHALYADVVVGPETGVLNAVAMEDSVHKIVMLSHSSTKNLTKHWVNTSAIVPEADCYPCHRLHYTREFCPEDKETGAAVCAASIGPEQVVGSILQGLSKFSEVA